MASINHEKKPNELHLSVLVENTSSAPPSASSKEDKLEEFHFFSKLAKEIQLEIWKLAVSTPRLVRLEWRDQSDKRTRSLDRTSLETPLLNICLASRSVALRSPRQRLLIEHFNKDEDNRREYVERCQFYYNPDVDTLYFSDFPELRAFICEHDIIPSNDPSPPVILPLRRPLVARHIKRLAIGGVFQRARFIFGGPDQRHDLRFEELNGFEYYHGMKLVNFPGVEELIFVRPQWATWEALEKIDRAKFKGPDNEEEFLSARKIPSMEDFLRPIKKRLPSAAKQKQAWLTCTGSDIVYSKWWYDPEIRVMTEEEFWEMFPDIKYMRDPFKFFTSDGEGEKVYN